MTDKVIKFGSPPDHDWIDMPKPARYYMPEWLKKMPTFVNGKPTIRPNSPNGTMKTCMPTMDSFLTGYIVELWQDIEVVHEKDGVKIYWKNGPDVLKDRDPSIAKELPIPAGHLNLHFVWKNFYSIQTPKGYSCLITHPLNRFDLPFTTMSAVVDTDTLPMGSGSIPFFLKEDFEGIIEKGTPIFQIIPFKRESWSSANDPNLSEITKRNAYKFNSVAYGFYKKFGWSRKSYE